MDTTNIDPIFNGHILPQEEWQARIETLPAQEALHLQERCERLAIECAMLSKYIGHRRHPEGDHGHRRTTREADEVRRAVKRALKYYFERM
jgi:hypothetical protein